MQLRVFASVFFILGSLTSNSFTAAQVCDVCGDPRASCFLRQADIAVLFQSSAYTDPMLFDQMKQLVLNLFDTFALGQCSVRVAMVNVLEESESEILFNFQSNLSGDEIFTIIDNLQQGTTNTTDLLPSLEFVELGIFASRRANVPRILVVVSDNLPSETLGVIDRSLELQDSEIIVIAVGVGNNVDPAILSELALNETREFLFPDSEAINSPFQEIFQRTVCHDVDECLLENGGCSDVCINTLGSFSCNCSGGLLLADDGRSCIEPSEGSSEDSNQPLTSCADNNGRCCQICIPTPQGRNCSCAEGYQLNNDGVSCSDINECLDSPCSDICVNTVGSFYCECNEEDKISEDFLTCVPRPGPADCPEDFFPVSHSCMTSTNGSLTYADAEVNCDSMNSSRLAKVDDDGTRALVTRFFPGRTWIGLKRVDGQWQNSDGTPFTYEWAYGEPREGGCGWVQNVIFSAPCGNEQRGACEIPRTQGFALFGHRWNGGRQGRIYLPTDVNAVNVTFPQSVTTFHVWYATNARRINARQFIITQNNIQRQSNDGHVGFVLFFRRFAFPDYQIIIQPYMP